MSSSSTVEMNTYLSGVIITTVLNDIGLRRDLTDPLQ